MPAAVVVRRCLSSGIDVLRAAVIMKAQAATFVKIRTVLASDLASCRISHRRSRKCVSSFSPDARSGKVNVAPDSDFCSVVKSQGHRSCASRLFSFAIFSPLMRYISWMNPTSLFPRCLTVPLSKLLETFPLIADLVGDGTRRGRAVSPPRPGLPL